MTYNLKKSIIQWESVCICICLHPRGESLSAQCVVLCTHVQYVSNHNFLKIVSEYDQEIPQSQTADNPVAPRGRAAQPSRDTRKTN